DLLEVPDEEENIGVVLMVLAAMLNIKIAMQETIKIMQTILICKVWKLTSLQ
ncbi:6398_t:CDS:2, partial [Paraglomus brasilianum]